MNPFAAKLVAIRRPWFYQPLYHQKEVNETVIVWGWRDGKYLLSRESGNFEIYSCDRVKLRLFKPGDVIPSSILQMVPGGGQRPGGR